MSEVEFSGTVERVERDGFGIVRFDKAIGGAEFGLFTTERTADLGRLLPGLRAGTAVVGICRDEGGDLRSVKRIGLPGNRGAAEDGAGAMERSVGVRSSWW